VNRTPQTRDSLTASTWREVLIGACGALAAHHSSSFAQVAFTVKGRTREYVAANPEGMIAPAQTPGTDLWVEGNQSAKSVQQVIGKLLAAPGHPRGEFAVSLA